jgi:hypothetical protein
MTYYGKFPILLMWFRIFIIPGLHPIWLSCSCIFI